MTQSTLTSFVYPRAQKSTTQSIQFNLPTKKEIFDEIQFCKMLANKTAIKLGLIARNSQVHIFNQCQIKPIISNAEIKLQQTKSILQAPSDVVRPLSYKFTYEDLKNIQLKNYERDVSSNAIDATSSYVEILCDDGKRVVVKKTKG